MIARLAARLAGIRADSVPSSEPVRPGPLRSGYHGECAQAYNSACVCQGYDGAGFHALAPPSTKPSARSLFQDAIATAQKARWRPSPRGEGGVGNDKQGATRDTCCGTQASLSPKGGGHSTLLRCDRDPCLCRGNRSPQGTLAPQPKGKGEREERQTGCGTRHLLWLPSSALA